VNDQFVNRPFDSFIPLTGSIHFEPAEGVDLQSLKDMLEQSSKPANPIPQLKP